MINVLHKVYFDVWMVTCLILRSQGTMIGRYFHRVYLSSITPYNQQGLETKHNVRSMMLCASFCMQYRCVCSSFLYDSSTKSCSMFTQKLVGNYGGIIGYTKNTGCALRIPYIANAELLTYSTCAVTFGCRYGFELIGTSSIQCQTDEEWAQTDTTCNAITCPEPEEDMTEIQFPLPKIIKLVMLNGYTVGSIAVYHENFLYCHERVCQIDGSWSDLKHKSGPVVNIQCSI